MQHDMVIDNATGLAVRQDINAALQALVTLSSGPVAPAVPYPGQLWLNTSSMVLMQRNQGNTAWGTFAISGIAPLASPAFTGNPTAPTAAAGDNDTTLATTAFVQRETAGSAPLASPAFTGNPTAPTPASTDNDTSIATTAFVKNQNYVGPDVAVNGRMYARSDGAWAIMAAASFGIVERVYGANATWTKPAAAQFIGIILEMLGAGGGGAGTSSPPTGWSSAGGGGGAGAHMEQFIPADSLSASVSIVIGAGGGGGGASSNGLAGGNTAFGTYQCSGGGPGLSQTYSSHGPAYGGAGGSVSGWNFGNVLGENGEMGLTMPAGQHGSSQGGGGGNSAYGGGGFTILTSAAAGSASNGYGSGGGGACSAQNQGARAGAAGRSGLVRIREIYGSY